MNPLVAQAAVNVPYEGSLLTIGLIACISVFVLLLAKKEIKNVA